MRISNYLIHVKLNSGEAVLFHGLTGAIDIVDAGVLDWLLASQPAGQVFRCDIEPLLWQRLCARHYLVEVASDELAYARHLGMLLHQRNQQPSGFYLILTYSCQLHCPYCCQRARWPLEHKSPAYAMDHAMIDAAFDAMQRIGRGRVQSLNLYGGEPLLTTNHGFIEHIVERAIQDGYSNLAVITNGVEVDAFVDLIGPNRIRGVCITLDGPPDIHNQRRSLMVKRVSGKGWLRGDTFERIVDNVGKVVATGAQVAIRLNVDGCSLSGLGETFTYLQQQPWWNSPQVTWNTYPIYPPPGGGTWRAALEPNHYLQVIAALKKEGKIPLNVEHDLAVGRQIAGLLESQGFRPLHPRHPAYCGSKQGIFIFDPRGDVYTCVDAVCDPRNRVGRFYPEFLLDQRSLESHACWIPLERSDCLACPYVLLCGGGCGHRGTLPPIGHDTSLCQQMHAMFETTLGSQLERLKAGETVAQYGNWL